ncbi:uncharacterized protein [Malus domestica]|uniref:uncharacterized protein n=1 Tax=Malus domestica TaxID=3750 RepID=UPI003976B70C
MDFDLALRENESAKPANDATTDKKNEYEKWVKANKMVLLIIKRSIFDLVQGAITELDNAKAYLDSIEAKFKESEKAETGTLMNTLITTKYLGGDVKEHILSMGYISKRVANKDDINEIGFSIFRSSELIGDGMLIGYPKRTKGYRFYCPNHTSRFIETRKAKFIEEVNDDQWEENLDWNEETTTLQDENLGDAMTDEVVVPTPVHNANEQIEEPIQVAQ